MADFTFPGDTAVSVSLDPKEYVGMGVPAITSEIFKVLKEIAPNVNFFDGAVIDAAEELHAGTPAR